MNARGLGRWFEVWGLGLGVWGLGPCRADNTSSLRGGTTKQSPEVTDAAEDCFTSFAMTNYACHPDGRRDPLGITIASQRISHFVRNDKHIVIARRNDEAIPCTFIVPAL